MLIAEFGEGNYQPVAVTSDGKLHVFVEASSEDHFDDLDGSAASRASADRCVAVGCGLRRVKPSSARHKAANYNL
jgi:hypothetical protein